MSKPKASRVSWNHVFLSYIHPTSFLQNAFWPEPFITFPYHYRLGSSQPSLGLLYTVFLNDLFPPFTTLKAILLKSKCAVELTSPKERSGLCLSYSEVMCHSRQKCPCSGQGFGLHSIDRPGILSSPPWIINHVHVMKPQYKFCGHQSSSEFPGWQLHALCHTSVLGA